MILATINFTPHPSAAVLLRRWNIRFLNVINKLLNMCIWILSESPSSLNLWPPSLSKRLHLPRMHRRPILTPWSAPFKITLCWLSSHQKLLAPLNVVKLLGSWACIELPGRCAEQKVLMLADATIDFLESLPYRYFPSLWVDSASPRLWEKL